MENKIKKVKFLAKLLDDRFEMGGIRFGLDPIINIIPWFGDAIGTILSLFIIKTAHEAGVSKTDMVKIIGNILVDFLAGLIPFLGIIPDVLWKANMRNVKILEKYSHGKFVEGEIVS